jgi:hypothetical protein
VPTAKKADPIEALRGEITTLTDTIRAEKQAKRWALRVVSAVLVLLMVVVGYLWHQNTQIIQARTAGRVAACEADRNFATNHDKLVQGVQALVMTVFHVVTAQAKPEVKADAEALISRLNTPFDGNIVPIRECDPASIAAFYKGKDGVKR